MPLVKEGAEQTRVVEIIDEVQLVTSWEIENFLTELVVVHIIRVVVLEYLNKLLLPIVDYGPSNKFKVVI